MISNSLIKKIKYFSAILPSLVCVACGDDASIKKGYEECKTFLRSTAVNHGFSADSIRFLYCDYVYFNDSQYDREKFPAYVTGTLYCVYSQGNITGALKDYRDVFLYDRSDNRLRYYDSDDDYIIFSSSRDLVTTKSVKGKIGAIKE